MEKESVVPDVVDFVPSHILVIKYSSGAEVKNGNELTPMQVKEIPTEVSFPTEEGALYTVIFVDPDAPSRDKPTLREVAHWVVVNIPGIKISKGKTLIDFIGSGPPEGTGLHRYVFLVFKQPGTLETHEEFVSKTSLKGRTNFKVRDFANKYSLGIPIAGNFYQAQYDEYCLELKKQLNY
jgi:phosphatidylethanolamine-binding protein (PEBP) family uncharacterized protein